MKVAVVSPYAFERPGGVQDQVVRIVGWLRDAGHEAWAVAPGRAGPVGTRHVGGFVSVPANRSRAPISLDPRAVRKVSRGVADADVVHIHEPFMPVVSLAAVLGRSPPRVGTFHADPGPGVRRLYRAGRGLLRRAARRLAVVTAVSDVAAASITGIATPRVVPNGIDLDEFTASHSPAGSERVIFIGRDERRKGVDVLLEAWPVIALRRPSASLRVIGVDRTDDVPAATFLGRTDEATKAAELAAADVLVAPNLGGESFGIVVLEGMAAGCAVVASNLPAFRSVGGDTAAYFPPGDAAALADTVVAALEAPDRIASMAAAGRERSARFGREEVLGGYLAAYEAALGKA